LLLSPPAS